MGSGVSIRQGSKITVRYYISSKGLDAKTLLNATRLHWLVESMHLMLDS